MQLEGEALMLTHSLKAQAAVAGVSMQQANQREAAG